MGAPPVRVIDLPLSNLGFPLPHRDIGINGVHISLGRAELGLTQRV